MRGFFKQLVGIHQTDGAEGTDSGFPQLWEFQQIFPSAASSSRGIAEQTINFDREREALNTSISNLKRQRNELETLYEIARVLNSTLDLDSVLQLVMDQVINVVNAERGFLMLVNPSTNELEFTIARDKQARTIADRAEPIAISR